MDITKTLKAVIIMDLDGKKVISKVFDESLESKKYERKLFVNTKTHHVKDEILLVDDTLVAHRFITDLHFYVIGNRNENPLILDTVLDCLVEVVTAITNKQIERQTLLDNLSKIILTMDEICANGLILETDPNLIIERVCLKDDVVEQTMAQKLQSATEQFKFPWLRSYS